MSNTISISHHVRFVLYSDTFHPSGALGFNPRLCGVRVAQSLVFYVVFCKWLMVFFTFFLFVIGHWRFLITSLIGIFLLCLGWLLWDEIISWSAVETSEVFYIIYLYKILDHTPLDCNIYILHHILYMTNDKARL